jgi:hypothetical protein
VFYTTNQSSDGKAVTWPFPDSVDASQTTNQANEVIKMLGFSNATEFVSAIAPSLIMFLNRSTNAQSATNKSFYGGQFAGSVSGAYVPSGSTLWLTGNVYASGTWTNDGRQWLFNASPTASNHVMTYYDFTSLTPIMESNRFIRNVDNDPHVWEVRTNVWWPPLMWQGGTFSNTVEMTSLAVIRWHTNAMMTSQDGSLEVQVRSAAEVMNDGSLMFLGILNFDQFAYVGTNYNSVSIKDGAAVTNLQHHGEEIVNGRVTPVPVTVASLATGNNVVTRASTNAANTVVFSATAGVATIAAIAAASRHGDWFIGVNATGYDLILTNESGFTAVATNRLRLPDSMTGMRVPADGMFTALFDTGVSSGRWRVSGGIATNFNAIAQSSGNGTNTTLVTPNAKGATNQVAWAVDAYGHVGVGTNAPSSSVQLHVHGPQRWDAPGSTNPTNVSAVVLWVPVTVNGTNVFLPAHQ